MNDNTPFWLMVANSAKAVFYRGVGPQGDLEKFHEMENDEARMQNQDLETDRPGRVKTPAGRSQRGETDPRGQAIEDFSVSVADYLETSRNQNKFKKLTLVAPPGFLGSLRNRLDSATENLVIETVTKNLVEQDVESVQENLEHYN